MNSKLSKALKIILPLLLGVFLIWYSIASATEEEKKELAHYISNADLSWVVLSIVLGLISHLSRAYRWNFLLKPIGYSVSLQNSFMAIMAGYLANLGIPRSGELIRAGIITTYEEVPFKKSFGTIISERVVDLLMLCLIILITLLFESEQLLSYLGSKLANPLITVLILISAILAGIFLLRLLKKSENRLVIKIRNFGEGLLEGVKSIYQLKKKWPFIIHTLLIWALYVLMFYVVKYTVPGGAEIGIGIILVTFVAGSLAISLTNGGIGVFPLAIAVVLQLYDIDKSIGLAYGWILWGSQTAITILFGALSFLLLPLLNRVK
ncbi:lysylphosphatidylglycerol synthase transmembrane domain-containing protein [Aquimarina brevivitae]|uniref:Lysylphosphatidylglycerol synthase-like protein n=1 Tax=Aquimarina brevivitae TaxID=323412 RepID=A0A4Q7PFY0_9FLAO|nr:lysylphosphatidylglycerol synthase transmembrane domain-containing protein [Aquimarina brevivitae]RZS99386.1 hypothetical protein EV197_0596 [Aquimarina brevivitae]